jgi:hypothetical protein
MRTSQQWMDLTRATTRNIDVDDLVHIALSLVETEGRGETAAVWHETSLVLKQKCNCAKCNPGVRFS